MFIYQGHWVKVSAYLIRRWFAFDWKAMLF